MTELRKGRLLSAEKPLLVAAGTGTKSPCRTKVVTILAAMLVAEMTVHKSIVVQGIAAVQRDTVSEREADLWYESAEGASNRSTDLIIANLDVLLDWRS